MTTLGDPAQGLRRLRECEAPGGQLQPPIGQLLEQSRRGRAALGLAAVHVQRQQLNVALEQLRQEQADLQAAVNALWAGGAEAMSIAGQRVIATSAVRCVGNTLLLNGEVFSPPFRIEAIGPYDAMAQRLDASPGVQLFRSAAGAYGLGFTVASAEDVQVPSYSGSLGLRYAHVGRG